MADDDRKPSSGLHMVSVADPTASQDQVPRNAKKVRMLLDLIGGETGMLGPLVRALNRLLEDKLLCETLDEAPVPFSTHSDDSKRLH
jgi:hypothetical protein